MHTRSIQLQGFRRRDGLYEVDARVTDVKTAEGLKGLEWMNRATPGAPVHDMWIRVVFDETFVIHDVIACTDAAPQAICPEAAGLLGQLKGLSFTRGWTKAVRERLGGVKGCTHLVELLGPIATTALQTLAPIRLRNRDVPDPVTGKPPKIDTCYAFSRHREVVKQYWPDHWEPVSGPGPVPVPVDADRPPDGGNAGRGNAGGGAAGGGTAV